MSADPRERALHDAHEDNRNELMRARRLEEHEAELRRRENDRWWRRTSALMPSAEPVLVQEFGTECTL